MIISFKRNSSLVVRGTSALGHSTRQPGETQEVTVTFDRAGTILYGCHVPGHYAAGMVGTLDLT